MKKYQLLALAVFVEIGIGSAALAESKNQIATITRKIGPAKIFFNPSDKISGSEPHVLYDGTYYQERNAQNGDQLDNGDIIQSGAGGRVRLIYDNGDQISLAPSSSYKISWDKNARNNKPVVDMLFGKLRATIQKGGGRSDMQVKTRSMVMGVRGTDFHVTAHGEDGGSKISVIRGRVVVQPPDEKSAAVEIPAGYSVDIPPPPAIRPVTKTLDQGESQIVEAKPSRVRPEASRVIPETKIVLRETTQQDLLLIQSASEIKSEEAVELSSASLDKNLREKIAKLEKRAIAAVILEIKKEDPELYKKISDENKGLSDIDQIQTMTIKKAFSQAPAALQNVKATEEDFESLREDVYKKYGK